MPKSHSDVIIVGAGHNGLVAAALLARHGLTVTVLEEKPVLGGATKTEYPFPKAPNVGTSTGAYLLGVMPPDLLSKLGANVTLIRRDPHYFLPTTENRYLLFGSNAVALEAQFLRYFTTKDWNAHLALTAEISAIRDDLAPGWLEEPLSADATAERYIRPGLRKAFVDLVNNPVEDYLSRFEFESELLIAMYAVTDGFSGLSGGFGSAGTGMNFLVHNMCRLPGSDATWMIVEGGMGSVAKELARVAIEAGVDILTDSPVASILSDGGIARGVVLADGREIRSKVVVSNADPFKLRSLAGADSFSTAFNEMIDNFKRTGTTMKVNLRSIAFRNSGALPKTAASTTPRSTFFRKKTLSKTFARDLLVFSAERPTRSMFASCCTRPEYWSFRVRASG